MNEELLPSVCPKHPSAQIKHTWDRTQFVYNQEPRGRGIDSKHRYECAECGTELCSPEEYERRVRSVQ